MRTKPFQNTGRTWFKKGQIPWNKGIFGWLKREPTGKTIVCEECGKEKYFEPNQPRKRPCKYCSVICARKASRKDVLVYSSIHSRIRNEWGKADVCEKCGSTRCVDWANKDNRYLLERNNWLKLCRKCHIHFDKTKKLTIKSIQC